MAQERVGKSMDKFITKRVVIVLASMCLILSMISVALVIALLSRPRSRFSRTDKTFVMFDNKTAQACWSGRKPPDPIADFLKYGARLKDAPASNPLNQI